MHRLHIGGRKAALSVSRHLTPDTRYVAPDILFRCAFDRHIQRKSAPARTGFSVTQVRELHDCLTHAVLCRYMGNWKSREVQQDVRASILRGDGREYGGLSSGLFVAFDFF